jgi:hypothetical protein
MKRTIKVSYATFESIIVAWLAAVGEIKEYEEVQLTDFEYDDYTDQMILHFEPHEVQLKLPFGDPLGR